MRGPNCRRAAAGLVVAAALAGVLSAGSSRAGAGDDAESWRREGAALAQRARSTALELYALETALLRSRGELARARGAVASASEERRSASRQLTIARATLAVAQRRLAERANALYVEGGVDPVEMLLGSGSLEEAIERVQGLEAVADHDRAILASTRAARRELSALVRWLSAREARLLRLERAAAARAASLAAAAAEKRSYLADVRGRQRLGAARIAAVERAAARRARATRTSATPPPAAAPQVVAGGSSGAAPAPAAAAPMPAAGARTMTVVVTGYALRGRTASGVPVGWGVAAVDPSVIPLGTRMTIPGYGEAVAADTGASVQGATVDVWFPSTAQALAWGRRTVTITVH